MTRLPVLCEKIQNINVHSEFLHISCLIFMIAGNSQVEQSEQQVNMVQMKGLLRQGLNKQK